MGALLQFSFDFVTETCCNCGISFAFTKSKFTELSNSGKGFYCPNGHMQFYTESEVTRLKKEIENEKAKAQWARDARDRAQKEAEHLKHVVAAEKGAKTKLKKRIANGVCPCCNRTFSNLMNHISTKHPEFKKEVSL